MRVHCTYIQGLDVGCLSKLYMLADLLLLNKKQDSNSGKLHEE